MQGGFIFEEASMLITHRFYTETFEGDGARVRNNVVRLYLLGIPVLTRRAEVWRKGASASDELREWVFAQDGYQCVYCGSTNRKQLAVDHRVPQIEGGLTVRSNLLTACRSCNSSKSGRTPEDAFMPLVYGRFASKGSDDRSLYERRLVWLAESVIYRGSLFISCLIYAVCWGYMIAYTWLGVRAVKDGRTQSVVVHFVCVVVMMLFFYRTRNRVTSDIERARTEIRRLRAVRSALTRRQGPIGA
jgi:hypothetical protein